jgi:hypothetical protein
MARRVRFIDSRGRSYDRVAARRIEDHLWKASLLRAFVARHGWQRLRHGAVVAPGVNIYNWVANLRARHHHGDDIADQVVEAVESIPGWTWDPVRARQVQMIDTLRSFVRRNGWTAWSKLGTHAQVDGLPLVDWVNARRQEYKRDKVPPWIVRALEAVPGWTWDPRMESHLRKLDLLRQHVTRHGVAGLHDETRAPDGTHIGRYAEVTRRLYRRGELAEWLVLAFERLPGWSWEPRRTGPPARWNRDKVVEELGRLHRKRVRITSPHLREIGRMDLVMAAVVYAGGLRAARRLAGIPAPVRASAPRRRRRRA